MVVGSPEEREEEEEEDEEKRSSSSSFACSWRKGVSLSSDCSGGCFGVCSEGDGGGGVAGEGRERLSLETGGGREESQLFSEVTRRGREGSTCCC